VSWDLFELLKVKPALGRTFTATEGTPVKHTVAIISYGAWQRRFGGDRSVLERPVTLNGTSSTIIGVMPQDFYFPSRTTEIWTPLAFPANATRGGHFIGVIARTKPGVSIATANTEMKTITERLAVQYPQQSANESAQVVQLLENIVRDIRPTLLTLLAAVGVVVLIACANVANLLLVRASVREKEIAIRAALGAGGRRLGLQMLAESVVLALAGGALGLLLAYLAIPAIKTLSAASVPRVADLSIDLPVLAFVASVSLLTGLIFGLAPAWHASRATLGHVLKEGGRTSGGARARWMRNTLLVAEVGLSIVLLVGATLLIRSFAKLTSVDPGFHPERVLAFQVSLPNTAYPEPHNRAALFSTLLEKLDALPEVASAGMVQTLPMRGDYVLSLTFQGRPAPPPNTEPSANYRVVSPTYFETLGIPILRGRVFNDRDTDTSPQVAVVDQAFVDRHFPNENPLGRRIDIGNGGTGFSEIIGVVGSVHYDRLETNPSPTMYVPYTQDNFSSMWIMARTGGDPARLAGSVRQVMREIDPALPAFRMGPLSDAVTESVAERRFSMLLLSVFAAIAVFLAGVGLYGVVAYTVTQRTQEIGLRMAIGAGPADVLRMVVGEGLKLAIIGVVFGIAAALALARVIESMLFHVTPFDAASYTATAVMLLAIATLASYVPARRAMRVDPLVALRQE
jgi:putative ABC transport system permease protein